MSIRVKLQILAADSLLAWKAPTTWKASAVAVRVGRESTYGSYLSRISSSPSRVRMTSDNRLFMYLTVQALRFASMLDPREADTATITRRMLSKSQGGAFA
ncbi:hypothetical protein LIA77_09915 [Sarocladium implicatum]|nr:hypothetical protein LIA77_09915 [Sarocladium implicatum]